MIFEFSQTYFQFYLFNFLSFGFIFAFYLYSALSIMYDDGCFLFLKFDEDFHFYIKCGNERHIFEI